MPIPKVNWHSCDRLVEVWDVNTRLYYAQALIKHGRIKQKAVLDFGRGSSIIHSIDF